MVLHGNVEELLGTVRCGATLRNGLILLQVVLNKHYFHKNAFRATLNEPLLLNILNYVYPLGRSQARVRWLGCSVVVGGLNKHFHLWTFTGNVMFCRRPVDVLFISLPHDYYTEPESRWICASSLSAGLISLRCPHEYFY